MKFATKEITLKDGRTAILRAPVPSDAAGCIAYMKQTAGETPFLLRTPEEVALTVEQEAAYLQAVLDSPFRVMLLCEIDGQIAGNCQLDRKTKRKNCHRGSIGIALVKEFWGLGIGSAMFQELISIAKRWELLQLELEVIEGNDRAMGLYRKMDFETVSYTPMPSVCPMAALRKNI